MTPNEVQGAIDRRWRWPTILVSLLIVLSTCYLRLADLSEPSLWFDEILHLQKANEALTEPWYAWLVGLSVDRENGPLYYATQLVALQFWRGETAVRLMPALSGITTVGVLYLVTLAASRDRRTALVAAALLALSPLHVYYSREARPFAAVMLMATLLLGLLLVEKRRWTVPAAWAICIATAYLGAVSAPVLLSFTVLSMLVWIGGLSSRPLLARQFSMAGILGLGVGILLFSSLEQISSTSTPSELIVTQPLSLVALNRLLGSLTVSGVEWASAGLRTYLMLLLAAAGVWFLANTDRWRAVAVSGMCILPIASWLALLVVLDRWYNVRYTSAGLPALMLLVAMGLIGGIDSLWTLVSRLRSRERPPWIPALAALVLTVVLIAPSWKTARTEVMKKPDWRGMAEIVGTLGTEDEPVVTYGWWAETCIRHYLDQGGYETEVISSGRDITKAQRLTADGRRAWLAAAGYVRGDEFRSWMRRTKPVVRSTLGNLELYYHPDFATFLNEPRRVDGLIRLLEARGERAGRRDFGDTQLLLGGGWSYAETTADGTSFRWAKEPIAEIGLLASSNRDHTIKIRVLPFPSPDEPTQTVEVSLNSHQIGKLYLDPGWREYMIQAPSALWQPGGNLVSFRFAWQQAPSDLDPSSADQRRLAAAFDFVDLIE